MTTTRNRLRSPSHSWLPRSTLPTWFRTHVFSHRAVPQQVFCRPHLEQHPGHRGGSRSPKTVVGGAGVVTQGILIPQGNDEGAFGAQGPARELEGSDGERETQQRRSWGGERHLKREGDTGNSQEISTAALGIGLTFSLWTLVLHICLCCQGM